jgi:hypothetical protein
MAHLPHLSHSFPPITSAAFQEDHLILTMPLMRSMSASGRVCDLLSCVPAMVFEGREWMEAGSRDQLSPFLSPSSSSSPGLHPPFLSGLKECIIRLYRVDRCLSRDVTVSYVDRRHLTLTRLVQSLACCPLLSSLSLTVEGEAGEEIADDSSIIDQLQTFPSLRTLILRQMWCDQQSVSLLLSLPLVHLDILGLGLYPTERDAVFPCSLS